jgi:hypothetical protein
MAGGDMVNAVETIPFIRTLDLVGIVTTYPDLNAFPCNHSGRSLVNGPAPLPAASKCAMAMALN